MVSPIPWSSPRTWITGEVLTAALLNVQLRDQLLELNGTTSVWQAWSPTLTGFAATINTARYKQIGKTVTCQFKATLTATPTNSFGVTPPVPVLTVLDVVPFGLAQAVNGTISYLGPVEAPSASGGILQFRNSGFDTSVWSPTRPFVWAAGHSLGFCATYETS